MLTQSRRPLKFPAPPAGQRGATLLITLVVLVTMMLAIAALIRTVDTTNVIAGNLSFKETSIHSADTGIEAASAWLEANATNLNGDILPFGYHAAIGANGINGNPDPTKNQTWDDFWNTVLVPNVVTLPTDAATNTVSYVIQRLCPLPIAPNAIDPATGNANSCASSTQMVGAATGATSQGAGSVALIPVVQQYYRITVRVAGPRGTVSFVQAVVVL